MFFFLETISDQIKGGESFTTTVVRQRPAACLKRFPLMLDKEWMMAVLVTRFSCGIGRYDPDCFVCKSLWPLISTIEHSSCLMRFSDNQRCDPREMITNSLHGWFDCRRMMCIVRNNCEIVYSSYDFCSSAKRWGLCDYIPEYCVVEVWGNYFECCHDHACIGDIVRSPEIVQWRKKSGLTTIVCRWCRDECCVCGCKETEE